MLPTAQFVHNSLTHEALKQSPFQLMYGTTPVALPLVSSKTNTPAADDRIKSLFRAREEALTAHDLACIKMMERTTRRTKPFKVNDKVWLESKNLKIPYESRKLSPKREGPFLIKEVLGPVTYRLTLLKQWKIHNVFHATLLTPFKETTFHGTIETRPPPDLVDGQQEYEVEAILTHQRYRGKYQYLVKWKGYDSSENTWEPEQNLTNMEELLNDYKRRRKLWGWATRQFIQSQLNTPSRIHSSSIPSYLWTTMTSNQQQLTSPIPTRTSTPESDSSQSSLILANPTATKKTYNPMFFMTPKIPTYQEQSLLPPTKREKLFEELEKLARELLIRRKELIDTIRQVKMTIRNQKYDSTDVLLHLLGQLTDAIIRYTEAFWAIVPFAPFMNNPITKDMLLCSNKSELLEILIKDLLLSPQLWDIIWRKTIRTDSKHYGDFCEMTESLSQYPTAPDTSSTGNALNLLKFSPILQRWNGNPMSTPDPALNNSDSMSLDD